jgi:hypothetical protein
MVARQRKTFQEILQEEAPRSVSKLEVKARNASWLAKIHREHSSRFYSIKHAALRQLFRIRTHAPIIRDAWTTSQGFLLSVLLRKTNALLHVPFNELNTDIQRAHGRWIARRARGKWWEEPRRTKYPTGGALEAWSIRNAR